MNTLCASGCSGFTYP